MREWPMVSTLYVWKPAQLYFIIYVYPFLVRVRALEFEVRIPLRLTRLPPLRGRCFIYYILYVSLNGWWDFLVQLH